MILVVETGCEFIEESMVFGPFVDVEAARAFIEVQKRSWLGHLEREHSPNWQFELVPDDNHLYRDGDHAIIWWEICWLKDPSVRN